jgi:hypothetical protein
MHAGRILAVLLVAAAASAQPASRRATNIAALSTHAAFYHLRPVVLVGTTTLATSGEMRVADDSGSLRVVYKGSVPDGLSEVRGEFWDLGRMNADDPRLAGYDLARTFRIDPEASWPRPGTVTAIVASAISPAAIPSAPTVRNLVLHPNRFLEQKLTVVGQFAGRNLLGDLPDAPAVSRYDFVLRSADAAIWVSNIRPRGRDFELALDARIDTGRWLEVSGTLQMSRGLLWLDATGGTLRLAKPPAQSAIEEPQIRVPAAPPPEVLFSAPAEGETDVSSTTNVRIQFSRDLNPSTLKDRVRVSYAPAVAAAAAAGAPPAAIEFTTQYQTPTRVLEIRFAQPLERFRTVQVELPESILGADQQPLVPFKLTFEIGDN